MNWIYIGEIVNTHGIKGEVRLISDFDYKKQAFKPGQKIYVGKRKEELTIQSYRTHKNYDMFTFKGINDINDVIMYKGDSAYIDRNSIQIDGYFNEDIIGLDVYDNETKLGQVEQIMRSKAHDILVIKGNKKKQMVPYIKEYIKEIDLKNHRIHIYVIEGLLNED